MGVGGLAPIRALLLAAVIHWGLWLTLYALAGADATHLGLYFLRIAAPAVVFEGFVAALCLVPLAARLRPRGVVALYLLAGLAWPLLSFWASHPYEAGRLAGAQHLHWLSAVPLFVYGGILGLLGHREGARGDGRPALPAYASLLTAAVLLVLGGLSAHLVARGGQFGLGFAAASVALLGGALKASALKGVAAGLGLHVLVRGLHGVPLAVGFLLLAAAVGLPTALSGQAGAGDAAWVWGAGLAAYALSAAAAGLPSPRIGRRAAPPASDLDAAIRMG